MRLLITLLCAFFTYLPYGYNQHIIATVHPGVELMTIVQVLGDRYPPPNSSTYWVEVKAHFEPYKNHPAVLKVQALSDKVYPDLTELGWCFSFPEMTLAFTPTEPTWYRLYGEKNIQEYLHLLSQFAKDTDYAEFYQKHEAVFAAWGAAIKAQISKEGLMEKLQQFYRFGADEGKFHICLDPLNSWGAHAIPHIAKINPQHANDKIYCIGYHNEKSTASTHPVFFSGSFSTNLIWHEGSHIFLAKLLKKHAAELAELEYLYNGSDEGMKRQNISTWAYCIEENLVRGVVLALFEQHRTPIEWRKQAAREIIADFIYAEEIGKFIADKYAPKKYSDFNAFFPAIIKMLKQKYPRALTVK